MPVRRPLIVAAPLVAACMITAAQAMAQQQAPAPVATPVDAAAAKAKAPDGMVAIPGGRFWMGSQNGDADAPLHEVEVSPFFLDATEVTNAQYAAFVAATHYVTDAEKAPTAEELPGVPESERVPGALVFMH